jgi:hypothetical protein
VAVLCFLQVNLAAFKIDLSPTLGILSVIRIPVWMASRMPGTPSTQQVAKGTLLPQRDPPICACRA